MKFDKEKTNGETDFGSRKQGVGVVRPNENCVVEEKFKKKITGRKKFASIMND